MTVKDCIRYAAESLALDGIAAALAAGGNPGNLPAADERELNALLLCANAVIGEIACEYVYLTRTQQMAAADRKILYSEFPRDVVEVLEVKKDGKKTAFRKIYGGIQTGTDGVFSVTYAYAPLAAALSDTLEFESAKINPRNIGYGIAAEHCIRTGMADDAALWDKRYKDSLAAAVRNRREQRVKPRRFV